MATETVYDVEEYGTGDAGVFRYDGPDHEGELVWEGETGMAHAEAARLTMLHLTVTGAVAEARARFGGGR